MIARFVLRNFYEIKHITKQYSSGSPNRNRSVFKSHDLNLNVEKTVYITIMPSCRLEPKTYKL